jgi:hypothetical protein
LIVPSRPSVDYGSIFQSIDKKPPEFESFYFYPRGRDALLMALRALRVKPGDAVVIPAYICDSTIEPLRQAGYQIVFIDIEQGFQLDSTKVLEAVEMCDAKAVLVVHYFGFPSDVGKLVALLRPRGIRIIEDCCHSFLSLSCEGRIGSTGDAAIFSMRKTLPTPDGGSLRLNIKDFDSAIFTTPLEAAPEMAYYLTTRALEAMVMSLGWPNIYSRNMDNFKMIMRGARINKGSVPIADSEPRRQLPSKLLTSYLSNEEYLQRVNVRTVENYDQLVAGALSLGLQPYIQELPSGCVPQWAPFDDPSGQIVPWLREHGAGACYWPGEELPAEVAALPSSYPTTNELNRKLAFMPVHQSIAPKHIARMLHLLKLKNTYQ